MKAHIVGRVWRAGIRHAGVSGQDIKIYEADERMGRVLRQSISLLRVRCAGVMKWEVATERSERYYLTGTY
jgi:hypothetical protein